MDPTPTSGPEARPLADHAARPDDHLRSDDDPAAAGRGDRLDAGDPRAAADAVEPVTEGTALTAPAGADPRTVPADGLAPTAAGTPRAAGPAADAAVIIEDATMRFRDEVAVDSITLRVAPGTILGVIGPSGAGKTTTIRMLTGALTPTEGRVRVLGEDPRRFHRRTRERIGYMPQLFTLYPDLTARENVDFVASLFGILWRTRHRRTREVLELVDLWEARSRRAGNLSGGMQRRLELACALVHHPDLLFLDEPTAGIDPLLRNRIWEELHRLRDEGRTLLVTTQYVNEAESCDQVALISGGRLIALADPDGLRRLAVGGDIIEVRTTTAFDDEALLDLPIVRRVEALSARQLRVTVDDAATALPDVVEAITQRGGDVASAQEARPSFDAVFATLVERDRDERSEGVAVDSSEAA